LLIVGGGLGTMMPIFSFIYGLFSSGGITWLSVDDSDLSEVFFGGEAWAILCNEDQGIPRIWKETATQAAKLSYSHGFSVGVLDCSDELPSGKTTYQRFRIKKRRRHPTAFYVANGKRPSAIPQKYLTIPKEKVTSTRLKMAAKDLVKYIKEKVKLTYSRVKSSHQIKSKCLKHPKCGLILHHGNLTSAQWNTLSQAIRKNRLLHWVLLDSSIHKFSLESKLPTVKPGSPVLVAFKRTKPKERKKKASLTVTGTVSAKSFRGEFKEAPINEFLDDLFDKESTTRMVILKRLPTIKTNGKRKKSRTQEQKRDGSENTRNNRRQRSKLDREKLREERRKKKEQEKAEREARKKKKREELERKERIRRERKRREEMDREARGSYSFTRDEEEEDGEIDLDKQGENNNNEDQNKQKDDEEEELEL